MIYGVRAPKKDGETGEWVVEVVFHGRVGPSTIRFATQESALRGYRNLLDGCEKGPDFRNKRGRRR
jgi:hypothetical protein